MNEPLEFPEDISEDENEEQALNILTELLDKNPDSRIKGKASTLMAHKYFSDIDWSKILCKGCETPFKPEVDSYSDLLN